MLIATVAGLTLSGSQPVSAPRQANDREVVYVDIDTLVQMHPAWQAVSMTGSVMSDALADSVKVGGSAVYGKNADTDIKYSELDPNIRQRLVSEAIRLADDAMLKLEKQQLEIVDLRLGQRRETMKKSYETEVTARAQEISEKAADQVELIARKYCADKINAELNVKTLQLRSGQPGIDDKLNDLKIAAAENGLARVNEQCSLETDKVLDQAKALTDSLWSNAITRTDASLSIIESGEKRKISNKGAASRNEILRELLSLYDFGDTSTALLSNPSRAFAVESSAAFAGSGRIDIADWREENTSLKSRIRQDVKIAVSRIAQTQGVRVIFTRKSKGIPDETKRFARLMSESIWNGCDPVISMAGDS